MYIRQQPISHFEEILRFKPESKLATIFSRLNLLTALAQLPPSSKYGPEEHDRKAIIGEVYPFLGTKRIPLVAGDLFSKKLVDFFSQGLLYSFCRKEL
ncbi:MAG: hypothetical protein ACM3YE_00220 [Bacteroidota bacterium]